VGWAKSFKFARARGPNKEEGVANVEIPVRRLPEPMLGAGNSPWKRRREFDVAVKYEIVSVTELILPARVRVGEIENSQRIDRKAASALLARRPFC
jgi:hypothetical protein